MHPKRYPLNKRELVENLSAKTGKIFCGNPSDMTDLKILVNRPRYIWVNEKKVGTHIVWRKVYEKTLIKDSTKLIVWGWGGKPGSLVSVYIINSPLKKYKAQRASYNYYGVYLSTLSFGKRVTIDYQILMNRSIIMYTE